MPRERSRATPHAWVFPALIALATLIAYSNSLHAPFIFDDVQSILENPTIRGLWPPQRFFELPVSYGIASRPIVNFTLALNYAVSGYAPWSYHLFNVLVHALAALTLFGVVRRTLLLPRLQSLLTGDAARVASPLAFASALLWALHPLQTQAVTYTIQRCESLMGLFFLLVFYGALRGWEPHAPRRWHGLALVAFLLGAGTKEVIAVAPFLLLLYDVLFVHGSVRESYRASRFLYAGLAVGLVPLAILVASVSVAMVQSERSTISMGAYARTQPQVILYYLWLTVWPGSLALDYAWPVAPLARAGPAAVVVVALAAASVWALLRRNLIGFPSAWFFVILAPSSSFVPLPDPAFEHRMYLPLAAVVVLVVVGALWAVWRMTEARGMVQARREGLARAADAAAEVRAAHAGAAARASAAAGASPSAAARMAGWALLAVLALALGIRTYTRNADYRSEISIWSDTVQQRPANARAHLSLGVALDRAGHKADAMRHMEESLRLDPRSAKTHCDYAIGLMEVGQTSRAIEHLRQAVEIDPRYVPAHSNLGIALCQFGRLEEGMASLREALRLDPNCVEAHFNLSVALRELGRDEEARRHFEAAYRLDPRYVRPE
jgi:Flp pilus assembly protein TadD